MTALHLPIIQTFFQQNNADADGGAGASAASSTGTTPSSLTVENGTGLADADAFVSVVDAGAWLKKWCGITAWDTATNAEADVWIRKATMFLSYFFEPSWDGDRSVASQALSFPRKNASWTYSPTALPKGLAFTGVPTLVVEITILLADEVRKGTVLAPSAVDKRQGIKSKSVTVGPISKQVSYSGAIDEVAVYQNPMINQMLQYLLRAGANPLSAAVCQYRG